MSDIQNPTDGPIHEYFELTYADHLVKNRTLLQSMPLWWQEQFVPLLRQLDAAFDHVEKPKGYRVTAGRWMQLDDMTQSELYAAGIELSGEEPDEGPGEDTLYHRTSDGAELESRDYGFVPGRNPIPHYRHAYIEPRLCARCKGSGLDPEHVAAEDHGDVVREVPVPCNACQLDQPPAGTAAPAPAVAPLAACQPSEAPGGPDTATRSPTGS